MRWALPQSPAGNVVPRTLSPLRGGFKTLNRTMRFAYHQTEKAILPRRGRIALSANESIAEFLDFAYVNLNCRVPAGGIQCDEHRGMLA